MASTITTEVRPSGVTANNSNAKVVVPAAEYSPWILLGGNGGTLASVACVPGGGGAMKAQFTYSLPSVVLADNAAGVTDGSGPAVAIDWTPGSVSANTAAAVSGRPVAVRFTATTAAGTGYVSQ